MRLATSAWDNFKETVISTYRFQRQYGLRGDVVLVGLNNIVY